MTGRGGMGERANGGMGGGQTVADPPPIAPQPCDGAGRMRLALLHTPSDSDMAESTPSDRIPITIEITPEQKRHIERLADQEGVSPEKALRAVVERELETSSPEKDLEEAQPGSFLDGLEHLVGSVEGPSDLSSNPDYMKGYGRS